MRVFKRPLVAFALGAALTCAVFAGRAAYATLSSGVVDACFKPSNGMLYLIDDGSARSACQPGDQPISWNVAGRNGADGVSVTSRALDVGDAHCPYGGSEFTSATGVTYACNGTPGRDGVPTNELVSPNGLYKVTVGDDGIDIKSLIGDTSIVLSHLGMTLRGASVVVRGDDNVDVRAGGLLNLQGSANASVSAGGLLDLRGASVHLNGVCSPVELVTGAATSVFGC